MAKGPRHAAPRKPLLTRLPSGGRIAFMAMPSALLLGVGLSPQLAQAQPGGQNPFRDGPCVSAPDRDPEGADDRKDADGSEKDGEKSGKDGPEESDGSGGSAGDRPDGGDADGPEQKPSPGKDKPQDEPGQPQDEPGDSDEEPEDEPKRNPLDPLGIGDKLRDLFNPDRDKESEEKKESDSGSGDSAAGEDEGSDGKSGDGKSAAEKVEEKAAEAKKKREATEKKIKEAAEEAAEADRKEREAEDAEKAAEAAKDGEAGEDASGKKPFPCPEFDKDAFDGAEREETPALVPDEPFKLNTTRLGLGGLKYHGIVKVRTYSGIEKRVLKFTAEKVDIKDLHQVVVGPGGTDQHIRSREGSTSTFRDSTVTMYTEELKGNLFGLIPVTFSPESPPPLDIPAAVFTDAQVTQAGQFGGTLKVPGLRLGLE
ncbi:hypothetical protein JGS22_001400 [Streptomyces sp. P38-E01]|uniref:Hydrogenase expression protein HypF n=1 Tax=Streptomyces tardus TaxID=2780544 RepID=A0A949JA87_9ACTN|nr:hypothetical protein [Streptomyces tardus]MBU7596327.1 hypothetical protein [Streptomyces tardus]